MSTQPTTPPRAAGAEERPLLRVENLSAQYSALGVRNRVLDAVSFAVRRGTTLGIVGESGCGKSTLCRVLLRLLPNSGGEVEFDGRDVFALRGRELSWFRRNVQIVFQDPAGSLNPRLTVETIVGEALEVHRLVRSRRERSQRVAETLRHVGLRESDAAKYPHEFSGGQRQRIGIARALALRPRLLVCDEPVSALDVSVRAQILNLLADLRDAFGLTLLLVAHDLGVVRSFCDEVAVMKSGRIVEHRPTDELFDSPRHAYTRLLLDSAPEALPAAQPVVAPRAE